MPVLILRLTFLFASMYSSFAFDFSAHVLLLMTLVFFSLRSSTFSSVSADVHPLWVY